MKPGSHWSSLKLRLAAMGALLIALSVALTVNLTLNRLQAHDEQVALDLSLAHTRRVAKMTSARLIGLQLALRSAAERMDMKTPVNEPAALEFLTSNPVLVTLFDTHFVSDPNGRLLSFIEGKEVRQTDMNIGDRPYFRDTAQQGRPIISPAILGRAAKEPVIVLTMPLLDKQGQLHSVIGGSLRLATRALMPEITAADDDDPSRTVIIDAQGRLLAHPDREWLMRDAAQEPELAGAMAQWAAQGRPVEPSGSAGRFDDQLVSMAGVPDADWIVIRSAPVSVVLGGGALAQRRAVEVGAAVAFGGGLILLIATFVMLRPLRRIEQCTVEALQGRTVDDALWPSGTSELGQLSQVLKRSLQARAESDAAGREVLERLQAVMERSPVGIAFTRNQHIEAASVHFHQLLGYPPDGLAGKATSVIYPSDECYQSLRQRYAVAFGAGQPYTDEIEFLRRDGTRFWGRQQGQPVRWGDIPSGAIWTLEDVTAQRQQRETQAWDSSHDALTRLVNRAEFERRLASHCNNRRREPTSALFIDLDRFKAVNDSAGHAAGDAVLIAVARVFESLVRQADTVARLGGDEFAVLLSACDREGAVRVAEKMRAAVEALRVPWQGTALSVGASLGVVELDAGLADVAAVLAAADAACYAAKQDGRNGVRVHAPSGLRLVTV